MAEVFISKKNNAISMGKLADLYLVITIDNQKPFKLTDESTTINVEKGEHKFKFEVGMSSLFVKTKINLSTEKNITITNDTEIYATISNNEISIDVNVLNEEADKCSEHINITSEQTVEHIEKTYSSNRKAEKMIITTTSQIDGYEVQEYITTVTGTDVYVISGGLGMGAVVTNHEKQFGRAYDNALSKMKEKAKESGANAIIGVSMNVTNDNKGCAVVMLIGTAVKAIRK